jgi:hypothetical protein
MISTRLGCTLDTLSDCHRRLSSLLGPDAEPLEVLARAEEHRHYWRPARVRVILLAESHVYTTSDELTRTISLTSTAPPDLPRGFVRLVYCLGYGENRLLNRPVESPPNKGTPQFWKVFHSCVNPVDSNADFSGIQASTPPAVRIAAKLALLHSLRDAGVWLLDACVAALYLPRRPKPAPALIERCLQVSWDSYVGRIVQEAAPVHIVCIGRGVARALEGRLAVTGAPLAVLPQPNARLSSAEHLSDLQTYYRVVQQANSLAV